MRALRQLLCSTLLFTVASAQAPSTLQPRTFDLDEATVADLQQRMESGRDTARSLAEKYLARIDAIDRGGPALHAVIDVNPDALSIADSVDAERKAGRTHGALHGIPVLIKDNIATADRMMTTAGSLALAGAVPVKDAFIVTRLREAGAVILGKTNLSEWANFRSTHSSSGWSGRGGLVKNPYALDRSASGSSSGSGAAIAANLAAAAVGTETDGSIVSPSSANGLVGIKPTLGLLSRTGIVPISHSQDTAGPMARTVADAAALLGAMAGPDADDPATRQSATKGSRDYTRFLDGNGLRGARLGVVRNRLFGSSPAADRLAGEAIADMKKAGAIIVDPANIPTLGRFDDTEFDVLLYEFKADLNRYLTWLGAPSPVHSLADVIAFNTAHASEEMPYFAQEIMTMAEKKGPLTEPKYRAALAKNHQLSRTLGIDLVMTKYRLDALVAPTGGPAWLTDLVNGDAGTGSAPSPSTVAAVAGYPHITVPAGFSRGLPVGVSFFGRAWSEPLLIKIAYAYEQATRHRRPPDFRASADLAGH
jgi:amidase